MSIDRKKEVKAEIKMLRNTLEIAKEQDAKNVVKYYCSEDVQTRSYIVLEFCPNGDLAKYMQTVSKGPVPENDVRKFLPQMVNGLRFLKKNQVFHRDIKRQNFLLREGNEVVIADFGLAIDTRLQRARSFVGTRGYTAPEILKQDYYDEKVDVYSMGVLLYVLLYTQRPNLQWNTVTFPSTPAVSNDMKDFIRDCLREDDSLRLSLKEFFQTVDDKLS